MLILLLKLILTLPFLLILPGFFLLLAFFGWRNEKISFFEKSVLAVPLSLISVDLIVLLLARINIPLKGLNLVGSILIFCLLCFIAFQFRFCKGGQKSKSGEEKSKSESFFNFSFWQTVFILLSIVLAIFIRTAYLSDTILPSSTDLGHHMYWVQKIIDSGRLPDYGMPDFIIGEHIIFAAVNLVSGVSVMSAMPALVLLLFNIAGIFVVAILLARLFKNKNIVAVSFFVAGVLYAINAPQAKYVSGGVVGNVTGNMLIPIALYFLYRALKEESQIFAGLFLFTFLGLLYTHHLSSLILMFSVAAILLVYLILNFRQAFGIIADWLKIFLKPFPIAVLVFGLWFLVFVFTPSYFNSSAVSQATGSPSKVTRIGLNFDQIEMSVGSARLLLGALGFLLILLNIKTKGIKYSFALGWFAILFVMTYKPDLVFVDIPSDRVGNYLFLPLTLLSAYALVRYFDFFQSAASRFFAAVLLFALMFFVITDGLADSAEAFKIRPQFQEAMQTFHSAEYLAKTLDTLQDVILKDHVNIYGDSWYKLYFMKDYKYPLSRGNLSRYIDPTKPRETCTRDMIMEPESDAGKTCFQETGVNYVVLNAQLEGNSFEKYPEFSKVYGSNYISVFRRN